MISKQRFANVLRVFLKTRLLFFVLFLSLVLGGNTKNVTAQSRGCYMDDGRYYPEGAIVGSYQCQYGRWVRIR
jgi:hypothetical protein